MVISTRLSGLFPASRPGHVFAALTLASSLALVGCGSGGDGGGKSAAGTSAATSATSATSAASAPGTESGGGSGSGGETGGATSVKAFCDVYFATEKMRTAAIGHLAKALPVYQRLAAVAPPEIKPSVETVVHGLEHAKGDEIPNFDKVFAAQQRVARFTLKRCVSG